MTKKETIIWFAGLFEGEGSISRFRPRPNSGWRMSIRMTDEDIMKKVHENFGGSLYREERWKKRNPNWNNCWLWQLCKQKEVLKIVKDIYPYMGYRRRAKMDEFLAHPIRNKSENAKRNWADPVFRKKWLKSRHPHIYVNK